MPQVLLLGDLHIPQRVVDVPTRFKELLAAGHFQQVLCTGNLCSKEAADWVKSLSADVHIVKGPFDSDQSISESQVITVAGWRFGLVNGYQMVPIGDQHAWADMAKSLDCEILVTGYSHLSAVLTSEGKYCLNPGSASGAYNLLSSQVTPSFMVLEVDSAQVAVYVYHLVEDKVEVVTATLTK